MLFIAWKNLIRERGRLLLSIGGVSFSVLLITLVAAVYHGWSTRITEYIESVETDLWVGQEGTKDLFHSFSLLPSGLEQELAEVRGVAAVRPFIGRQFSFERDGEEAHLFIVGVGGDGGTGGPVQLVEGTADVRGREIVIDRVLARQRGLAIGDAVSLGEHGDWTVVGIAEGGNQVIYSYAYVDLSEARRLLGMEEFVNYFLVRLESGTAVGDVRERIEEQLHVRALTKDAFVEENRQLITDSFLPILSVLAIVAFGIGTAVVGLTIFTATIERVREYGVLKAIGFSAGQLYRVVLAQSLIASLLGYAVGVLLALGTARLAARLEPSFLNEFRVVDVVAVFILTLAMALVAAWAPTRRIASIDPAETFRV